MNGTWDSEEEHTFESVRLTTGSQWCLHMRLLVGGVGWAWFPMLCDPKAVPGKSPRFYPYDDLRSRSGRTPPLGQRVHATTEAARDAGVAWAMGQVAQGALVGGSS